MSRVYFVDTLTLEALNDECVKNIHCTRCLSDEAIAQLDEEGKHIIVENSMFSRMSNTGFKRYQIYMKFDGDPDPKGAPFIDLTDMQQRKLIPYTKQMDELLKNARECLECGQVSPHLQDDYKCWHCRSDEEKEVPELEAQKPLNLHDL